MGAAVHSGIMGGELQEVVLLDVTPHDMGVKVAGDRMSVVITSNTSIPTRAKKVFATTEDNQTFVAIEIYQGEHELASKNRRLGRFVLGDLRDRAARPHQGRGQLHDGRRRHPRGHRGRGRHRHAVDRDDRGLERPDAGRDQRARQPVRALQARAALTTHLISRRAKLGA